MIEIQQSLAHYYPELGPKLKKFEAIFTLLEKLFHLPEINQFINNNKHLKNFTFLDAVLKEFDFSYRISNKCLQRIPAEGKVIIIANHPIGSLDGLALLRMVYDVRSDVKVMASSLLGMIEPLNELFLSVDNISKQVSYKKRQSQLNAINDTLNNDQALIIFPAGEVSRMTPKGIMDGAWKTSFIRLAERHQAPIVPVFNDSRNSMMFYASSLMYKPLSSLLLIHEMYKQKSQSASFTVGEMIVPSVWKHLDLPRKKLAKRFKKHVFKLTKNKPQFQTTTSIAHPIKRKRLYTEISQHKPLGCTADGMHIYLIPYQADSQVIQEIGRLRELSFRQVNEGTGRCSDIDSYDVHYQHLLVWNPNLMDVVGAYRIGFCEELIQANGLSGLYCNNLYQIDDKLIGMASQSIELGRSFVQPKYWGMRGLEYLWYGLGALLANNPQINYLFGAVTIPGHYSQHALNELVNYYRHYHPKPDTAPNFTARNPFKCEVKSKNAMPPSDARAAFKELNKSLKNQGYKVPMLFKQYTDLCIPGGVGFVDFAVDQGFNDCVDGLIWLDITQMKEQKRKRYINQNNLKSA